MKKKDSKPIKRIKDLDPNKSLVGVHFRSPDGTTGYWYSQWGYEDGKAGVWYKRDMESSQVLPLFLDDLQEALDFEIVE